MPLTPFDPVPSHAAAPQPSEEDYKQIVEMMKSDPNTARGILSNLTPQESQGFNAYMNTYMKGGSPDAARAKVGIGGSDDVTPALMGMGAVTGIGTAGNAAVKAGVTAARTAGKAAVKHPLVQSGAMIAGSRLLPAGVMRDMMEMLGMMRGMGGAGKAEEIPGERIAPMSDAEYLAQTGHPRGGGKPIGLREPPTMSDPPNLIRQGNVTNPGPGGMGSPSTPSRPIQRPLGVSEGSIGDLVDKAGRSLNPLDSSPERRGWKGPLANEDNWHEIVPPKVSQRVPNNVQPNSPQQSLATGDEVDKRRVIFGGANGGPPYVKPEDRTPVGRRKPKAK